MYNLYNNNIKIEKLEEIKINDIIKVDKYDELWTVIQHVPGDVVVLNSLLEDGKTIHVFYDDFYKK